MPPHFRHMIRWQDLVWCCSCTTSNTSNPVTCLPIGSQCHKIHIRRRRDELVVQHHSYLQSHVCHDSECLSLSSSSLQDLFIGSFVKHDKFVYKVNLVRVGGRSRVDQPIDVLLCRSHSFLQSFFHALNEVGKANLQRLQLRNKPQQQSRQPRRCDLQRQQQHPHSSGNLEEVIRDIQCDKEYNEFWSHGDCEIIYHLLLRNRPDLIIEGHQRRNNNSNNTWDLSKTFDTQFGGQAVGNFWNFLLFHVMSVYIDTNLVLAASDVNMETVHFEPPFSDCFGPLWDCDGRTFLHPWRYALQQGIYLKDMTATMNMLKGCFSFLANLHIVLVECKLESSPIQLSDHFENVFRHVVRKQKRDNVWFSFEEVVKEMLHTGNK